MGKMADIEQLRKLAEHFVGDEPDRMKSAGWWQTPLVVTAAIDHRFAVVRDELLGYRHNVKGARAVEIVRLKLEKDRRVLQPFRLIDSRRMRSGELHYVDHPAFGVLALATPYVPPEPEQPAAGPETPGEEAAIETPAATGTATPSTGQPARP